MPPTHKQRAFQLQPTQSSRLDVKHPWAEWSGHFAKAYIRLSPNAGSYRHFYSVFWGHSSNKACLSLLMIFLLQRLHLLSFCCGCQFKSSQCSFIHTAPDYIGCLKTLHIRSRSRLRSIITKTQQLTAIPTWVSTQRYCWKKKLLFNGQTPQKKREEPGSEVHDHLLRLVGCLFQTVSKHPAVAVSTKAWRWWKIFNINMQSHDCNLIFKVENMRSLWK